MALLVLLVVAATFRFTRLVVSDAFPPVAALRDAVDDRWGVDSWQAYLSTCPWCVSVYVAAAVTALTDRLVSGGLVAPVLVAAAASGATGLLGKLDHE